MVETSLVQVFRGLLGKSPHAAERRSVGRQEFSILETLGNPGDFIGGIAVVVTLIYLAVQIRQNTVALRTASRQAIASDYRDSNRLQASTGGTVWWEAVGRPIYAPGMVKAVDRRVSAGGLHDIRELPTLRIDESPVAQQDVEDRCGIAD